MNGFGSIIHPSGNYYIGYMKNNKYHGKGTFWYVNGECEEGNWEDGIYQHTCSHDSSEVKAKLDDSIVSFFKTPF